MKNSVAIVRNNILRIMEEKGISMEELASKMQYSSRCVIYKHLKGTSNALDNISTLKEYARALSVDTNDLLKGSDIVVEQEQDVGYDDSLSELDCILTQKPVPNSQFYMVHLLMSKRFGEMIARDTYFATKKSAVDYLKKVMWQCNFGCLGLLKDGHTGEEEQNDYCYQYVEHAYIKGWYLDASEPGIEENQFVMSDWDDHIFRKIAEGLEGIAFTTYEENRNVTYEDFSQFMDDTRFYTYGPLDDDNNEV